MNIKNVLLIVLLSIAHNIISSETKITGYFLDKEEVKQLIAYCNAGANHYSDTLHVFDNIPIFFKNGILWKTVGDIKKWDLQQAPVEERMSTLKARSVFFNELHDQRVVVCQKTEKDFWGNTTTESVFVRGAHNCLVCDERFFK